MDKINVIKILKNGFPEKHGWPEEHYKDIADEICDSQWISVEDRLPEDEEIVLAYADGYMDEVTTYWLISKHATIQWYHVTHWQPLPEPPKD